MGRNVIAKKEAQPSLFDDGGASAAADDGYDRDGEFPVAREVTPSDTAHEVEDRALRRQDGALKAIRHPVEFAALVPVTWRISMLGRKLWLFMVSYSLQSRGTATDDGVTWRVAINTLKRDADYDSNDYELLRTTIQELQKTLVSWSNPTRDKKGETKPWESTQLLGSVSFVIDASGRHCVEWSLPQLLAQQIREHKQYYEASLQVATRITRHSTLALHSLVSRYKSNPNGLTMRKPWREWVPIFTGESEEASRTSKLIAGAKKGRLPVDGADQKYNEWRYFNRDVVSKMVNEYNAVQDEVIVEALPGTKAGTKSVVDLQFKVHLRSDFVKPSSGPIDNALTSQAVAAMTELGLSKSFSLKLSNEHGADLCIQIAEQVSRRVKDGTQAEIKNQEGFFVAELGKASELLRKPKEQDQAGPAGPKIMSVDEALEETLKDYQVHLIAAAKASWPQMPKEVQEDYVKRFELESMSAAPPSVQTAFRKSGIKTPMIASRFYTWLAKDRAADDWSPTVGELLAFERNSKLAKKK